MSSSNPAMCDGPGANKPMHNDNRASGRGGRTTRAKSEIRRHAILKATIRVAAKDGIKGIKHRSVAREAGVPLAATTYYFRDINELISDAFMLYAKEAGAELKAFHDTLNLVLDGVPEVQLRRGAEFRPELCQRLTDFARAWMQEQFTRRREQVLAEQVFLMEALRDDRLARVARRYRQSWIDGLEQLLVRLDSPCPRQDGTLIVNVVLGMSYDLLLEVPGTEAEVLSASVARIVQLALGVEPEDLRAP
ncbi:TetR/AcrR family transcriptional regulator [Marinobacter sp. EVN1]|uniref:TetR/AcrR family transcriptional regulator n=1 Tax=Marinobacter sp. EVN1 TaxID=1397532 RepID=UPI0004B736F7|nr:TetR family transcriptional regulator [Marinobacter sp. EVN1]